MISKRMILATLVALAAPLVSYAAPTPPPTLTPETLQMYDSRGKLVGTPTPFVNNCTEANFELFGACEEVGVFTPTLSSAATVAMKYSGGGSFTLNIAEIPEWPHSPDWVPDFLYYVLPNCSSQAYMDTGNYFYYTNAGFMTSRLGVVGGGVSGGNPVYVSAMNPSAVSVSYKSFSFEYEGCTNGSGEIPNAVAVSPANISLDSVWTPPFHLQ